MRFLIIIFAAYILDHILGDPVYPFHPIRLIGKLIAFLEKILYPMRRKKLGGALLLLLTSGIIFLTFFLLAKLGTLAEILLLYTALAGKCLRDEGIKVYNILQKKDIALARRELSYLVSRDTDTMDDVQIIRSTFETLSENSVDGVVAPLFFAFLGSFFTLDGVSLALPFAMVYKGVNTLDSMVGYKNERYLDFGMFSAKADDLLNFIPARIAGGGIIPLSAFFLKMDYRNAWRIFFRDRKNHSSPNSGCPESAFAGALGVQLGGETSYFGKIVKKPHIGDRKHPFSPEHVLGACSLLRITAFLSLILFSCFFTLISLF